MRQFVALVCLFSFLKVLLNGMDRLLSADPPYISEAKGTGVPVGQKGTLQCEASAVPSAEFQWFKDDKRYGARSPSPHQHPFPAPDCR